MKTKNKHILVVSQYFYPEQFRINDICQEWIKRGYDVTVLTGIPNYPLGKFYKGYGFIKNRKELWKGVNIIRIPLIPRGHSPIGLILNYLSFVVSGFFWCLFTRVRADYVFNYEVSPMTQVKVGVWFSKKNNIPCYLYLTDLWPDNVQIVTGINNKFFINSMNKMINKIYKNCSLIFTSSKSFINKLIERGVQSNKLIFWPQYAEAFYKPIALDKDKTEIPQDSILNITFAGNIGAAQGLSVLVKSAVLLKSDNILIRFNIIGDGRYKNTLINEVYESNVEEYFNFIEKQPAEKIPIYMAESDVALICLATSEVFSMTIPAKTQSCLACGKPILLVADGEVQEIIKEAECGFVGSSMNENELYLNIIKLNSLNKDEMKRLGDNSLKYCNKNFNREKLLRIMDSYFV